jgi:hypothetical protein
MSTPSTNGDYGRDQSGRFVPGNKLGRGNPFNQRACELRSALMEAVTADDVAKIIAAIVKLAKAGDVVAAREILDRTIGKPAQTELLQRVEALESLILERQTNVH